MLINLKKIVISSKLMCKFMYIEMGYHKKEKTRNISLIIYGGLKICEYLEMLTICQKKLK